MREARYGVVVLLAWMAAITNVSVAVAQSSTKQDPMLATQGQTMGSTYMVKIFAPPDDFPDDWTFAVDAELRQITDQMSTYIESSEISAFNRSESLEWFPVSAGFVKVVVRALEMSKLSDGAFDITVLPLVKAWSFGPGKKRNEPPSDEEIATLRQQIGYQYLEARLDPPALRKQKPWISIDLNSITPGYAADRIVEILQSRGAKNLFVEVGGEIRVTGDKAGDMWTVGIQQPDTMGDVVAIAYPLRDRSLATSGDYRSFFMYEGKRYSHTIDPRTGRPVTHNLASVTVLADDCMTADAMSTTMCVLGDVEGLALARRLGWDTLMMVRTSSSDPSGAGSLKNGFQTLATGEFESIIQANNQASTVEQSTSFFPIVIVTAVAFGLVIAAMAVGVMFGRRSISGSCGGLANRKDPDGNISCALCSNPDNACKELRDRMGQQSKV